MTTFDRIISEASLGSTLLLSAIPMTIFFIAFFAMILNLDFEGSIYYGIFGSTIPLIVMALSSYAFYESIIMFIRRHYYIYSQDGHIFITNEDPIQVKSINDVKIVRTFFWSDIKIKLKCGSVRSIRGYLLKKSVFDVRELLNEIIQSRDDLECAL